MQCECNDHAYDCDTDGVCLVSSELPMRRARTHPETHLSDLPLSVLRGAPTTPRAPSVTAAYPVSTATPPRARRATVACVRVL